MLEWLMFSPSAFDLPPVLLLRPDGLFDHFLDIPGHEFSAFRRAASANGRSAVFLVC
jgi:hypothetical protein